jgi:hypothetical protein
VQTCFLYSNLTGRSQSLVDYGFLTTRFLISLLRNLSVNSARVKTATDVSTKCSEGDIAQFGTWKPYIGKKPAFSSSD